jgi:ubiquitin-protein ligase
MNALKVMKTMKKFKKRIAKELKSNTESKEFGFAALNSTYWYFQFTITDGPYMGQKHIIEVKLVYGRDPSTYVYPMSAPMCSFVTPIWHPNISYKGTICLDVLKDNWSPSMYTGTIISALKILLLNPEPSSPQNPKAAEMMTTQPEKYKKYIHEFYEYDKAPSVIRKLFG